MASTVFSAHICPEVYNNQSNGSLYDSSSPEEVRSGVFYKPVTALTNLQRGNVPTQAPIKLLLRCIHQLVAQGDIPKEPFARSRIELCDNEGLTPLMWAAFHGQLLSVRKLIEEQANVNARGYLGQTALSFASFRGHTCVVKELLAHGASVNHADCDGCTALMYAASGNHGEACRELLDAGASLHEINEFMDSAYDLAVQTASKRVLDVFENYFINILGDN